MLVLDPTSSPKNQLDQVEEVARKLHGRGRHLLIDASEVAHLTSFGTGPLRKLADRLDGPSDLFAPYPVPFEPVIRSDASADELDAFRHLCAELGLGGALRVKPTASIREDLEGILRTHRWDGAELDLILDLQYIPEATPQLRDDTVRHLLTISATGSFRSTTLLSGSVPRALNRTATWQQTRAEEGLWRHASEETPVGLRLGDYGAVHPRPGGGHRSKHVSLKYSCRGRWMYSREPTRELVDEEAAESARGTTLRAICRNLAHSDGFSGPDFSWGDEQIATASTDHAAPWGAASRPVALATSHHLAYLAARFAT